MGDAERADVVLSRVPIPDLQKARRVAEVESETGRPWDRCCVACGVQAPVVGVWGAAWLLTGPILTPVSGRAVCRC